MKKQILIFVDTEYHLLLAVNQILSLYNDQSKYIIELYLRKREGRRLSMKLDFSHLPVSVHYRNDDISIYHEISDQSRLVIESFMQKKPDIFIFFQEQDPLMVILSGHYAKSGSDVYLFQEGTKPYLKLKYHSLGLLRYTHKQNLWMLKYGFPVESWLSPIFSKKYAFLKGITEIFLTNPEYYNNWNHKTVKKIEFLPLEILNPVLKKLFIWDDSLLPEKENLIFFLNQPFRDDGKAESEFLSKLGQVFPNVPVYIKLHPLTVDEKLKEYKSIKNVRIIKSDIPAELFIMNLKRSVILSLHSTALLLNNPENKFYYIYKLFELDNRTLKRYQRNRLPLVHINRIQSIEEIKF